MSFSTLVDARLRKLPSALNREKLVSQLNRYPYCYGSATPSIVFVGPGPGHLPQGGDTTDKMQHWGCGEVAEQLKRKDEWSPFGPNYVNLMQMLLGDLDGENALMAGAVVNLSTMHHKSEDDLDWAEVSEQGAARLAPVLELLRPRVLSPLSKRTMQCVRDLLQPWKPRSNVPNLRVGKYQIEAFRFEKPNVKSCVACVRFPRHISHIEDKLPDLAKGFRRVLDAVCGSG